MVRDGAGRPMHGLVARVPLRQGVVICKYEGEIVPPQEDRNSVYLMYDATTRRVIDGDPRKGGGLASFANYASWGVANALFTHRPGRGILLIAKHDIRRGQEIRCDYDTNCRTAEYRSMILSDPAITPEMIDSNSYLFAVWNTSPPPSEYDGPADCVDDIDVVIRAVTRNPNRHKRRPGGAPLATERFVQLA